MDILTKFFLQSAKGYYICNRISPSAQLKVTMPDLLEKWQSGRLRQS